MNDVMRILKAVIVDDERLARNELRRLLARHPEIDIVGEAASAQQARSVGVRPAFRVAAWLSEWSKLDPAEPHLHLGPIGVDPEVQGRQIGRRLMEQYCQAQDQVGVAGYLETDRPENVDFYRRFDFEVAATRPVLDVPNYFMRRRARRA